MASKKSDRELLEILVQELQGIRELLEAGNEITIDLKEKRSNAWEATLSGTGKIEVVL